MEGKRRQGRSGDGHEEERHLPRERLCGQHHVVCPASGQCHQKKWQPCKTYSQISFLISARAHVLKCDFTEKSDNFHISDNH